MSLPAAPSSTNINPPELWNDVQFGVFREHFDAEQQQALLDDDVVAQFRVSGILASLIGIGTLLAIATVLFIALS